MVEIRDITAKKTGEIERANLEKKLAEECFPKEKIEISGNEIYVRDKNNKTLAVKWSGIILMNLYDESILPQAQEFGRRYEEQFNISNFIIETDYSRE